MQATFVIVSWLPWQSYPLSVDWWLH